MNNLLKPERLAVDPNSPIAAKEWRFWHQTFKNFLTLCGNDAPDKYLTIINLMSHSVYDYVEDCTDYNSVVAILEKLYVKTPNEIFARHLLATRRQQSGESLDEFLLELRKLSKDCNLKAVSAEQYKEELVRDSFINGLSSPLIRQRLLENKTLTLDQAYSQATSLDVAQKNSAAYSHPAVHVAAVDLPSTPEDDNSLCPDVLGQKPPLANNPPLATTYSKNKCFYCGGASHHRRKCPAREAMCHTCAIKGHFSSVCMKKKQGNSVGNVATTYSSSLCALGISAAFPSSLSHAAVPIVINGVALTALIDSCSSESFINEQVANRLKLTLSPSTRNISMALTTLKTDIIGCCTADITLNNCTYTNVILSVLKDLCSDVILGHDFQKRHKRVTIELHGPQSDLIVSNSPSCALAAASVDELSLFANVNPDSKPIATKSRRFSFSDKTFIAEEISRLMSENIIEHSTSPWRAQVVVVKSPSHPEKKRLCVDYSQTVNQYTEVDAYPLPRIDDMINNLAKYRVFSTFDLKNAYHQLPICDSDKKYTGFEANGKLYQFCRIPFGVTNGVAVFQRQMDKIIEEEKLMDTFSYLDDITVAGHTQEEHDTNVAAFMEVIHRRNLTLNESKSVLSSSTINILGYLIGNGVVRPDPERLRPLQELPPPTNVRSHRRALGLFAYYAKWIPNFSEKIQPLSKALTYPLCKEAIDSFNTLKGDMESAALRPIDEGVPFVVECDASETTLSATLNQRGRPVAFMSRTLQSSELHYPPVEKEATAIIEAVRKWEHLLARQHFMLITDQRSVAFMLDNRKRTKIKNNKIQGWRLELASFSYTIQYRPGIDNVGPDTFTRAFCASVTESNSNLSDIHKQLSHPGVTRMLHFVRSKNLPYSTNEVKKVCSSCRMCAELKPRFHKPPMGTLIKSTQPMERLNIDFKGPLPSSTPNKYFLTIIDEYSRFPFVYPCSNISSQTVIKCLNQLFSLCGTPSYIHSDRGASFLSNEMKEYLSQKGIATSRTTPYHPIGNSQCERYNGIVWKSIQLTLKSHSLPDSQWEMVLPDALHSIRSLLSTATNTIPHERFFGYQRRSSCGSSIPSWLSTPGPVMLRRFVRHSKTDPLVDEVQLMDVNPSYAYIRYSDGRESTVSLKDLSPCPASPKAIPHDNTVPPSSILSPPVGNQTEISSQSVHVEQEQCNSPDSSAQSIINDTSVLSNNNNDTPAIRKSSRVIKPPDRLTY